MKYSKTELQARIETFVNAQQGRFSKWVSDEFLVGLLLHEIDKALYASKSVTEFDFRIVAYQTGCYVFEMLLEHGCEARCNGHHVAQAFSDMFKD